MLKEVPKWKKQIAQYVLQIAGYIFDVWAMFRPATIITTCILLMAVCSLVFGYGMFFCESKFVYDVCFAMIVGVIASTLVAIVIECVKNLQYSRKRENLLVDLFMLPVYYEKIELQCMGRSDINMSGDMIKVMAEYFPYFYREEISGDKILLLWGVLPKLVQNMKKISQLPYEYLLAQELRVLHDIDMKIQTIKDVLSFVFRDRKDELIREMKGLGDVPEILKEKMYQEAMEHMFDFPGVMNLNDVGIVLSEKKVGMDWVDMENELEASAIIISRSCNDIRKDLIELGKIFSKEPCVRITNLTAWLMLKGWA